MVANLLEHLQEGHEWCPAAEVDGSSRPVKYDSLDTVGSSAVLHTTCSVAIGLGTGGLTGCIGGGWWSSSIGSSRCGLLGGPDL